MQQRRDEADEFYSSVIPAESSSDARLIQRQVRWLTVCVGTGSHLAP